jgi:hypothetical protein
VAPRRHSSLNTFFDFSVSSGIFVRRAVGRCQRYLVGSEPFVHPVALRVRKAGSATGWINGRLPTLGAYGVIRCITARQQHISLLLQVGSSVELGHCVWRELPQQRDEQGRLEG